MIKCISHLIWKQTKKQLEMLHANQCPDHVSAHLRNFDELVKVGKVSLVYRVVCYYLII